MSALQVTDNNIPNPGETFASMERTGNMTPEDIEGYETRRVKLLEDLFLYSERVKRGLEPKWQRAYEFYHACDVEYRKKQKHQSKIVLPTSFEIVETKTPQLVMSMFSQQPIYSVNAVGNDDPYKAKIAESLLTWQLLQMRNSILNHTLWIKDSHLFGGAVAKTGWDYDCEVVPRNVKTPPIIDFATMSIMQEHKIVSELVVTKDQPTMVACDIGEIYPDPCADTVENSKFIIHRMLVPYVDLIKMQQKGIYKNVDKLVKERTKNVAHWASEFSQRRFSTHNFEDPFTFSHSMYEYAEILEFWWTDPTDPELKKYKTVVGNRRHILQDVPLGQLYWHNRFPFILLKNIPMNKEFWGISEIDVTLNLQREKNSLRNQRMDMTNAFLKAYWIVSRSAGVNKEKMKKLAPGDLIYTNDINGIKAERPPNVDSLTLNAEQITASDIQRAANMTDTITGTPTRSQFRNATTASLMDQNAKTRWGLTVLLYTEQMRRVGEDFCALNNQFLTEPQVISIVGEDGKNYKVPVDYTDIPRNPDVYVTLGYEIQTNKELRKNMLLQLDGVVTTTPGANVVQWRKDMLKDFGFKNPERYFEGAFVTPSEAFLSSMGVKQQPQSSYKDQLSQIRPDQPNQLPDQPNEGELMQNAF